MKELRRCHAGVLQVWCVDGLTLAGFAVAAQAETGATAAGPGLVAVAQQAQVRAASGLPVLIRGACVTPHCQHRAPPNTGRDF